MKIIRPFVAGFCLFLFACQQNNTLALYPDFPLVKEKSKTFFQEASMWSESAYLYSITIAIPNSNSEWKTTFVFNSPDKPYSSLFLIHSTNNDLETFVLDTPDPVLQRKPINDSDWKIDGNKALQIFISHNQAIKEFLGSNKQHCSDLVLERFSPDLNQPVVWSLSLFDCVRENDYYYLDPITGDILDLSRNIIPDNILIAPRP